MNATNQNVPIPDWALDVEMRLKRLRVYKTTFAKKIGVNYNIVVSTLTGYLNRPDVQEKILAGIRDLEKEGA